MHTSMHKISPLCSAGVLLLNSVETKPTKCSEKHNGYFYSLAYSDTSIEPECIYLIFG